MPNIDLEKLNRLIDQTDDPQRLEEIKEYLDLFRESPIEDNDSPKVLKRELTEQDLLNREKDTQSVLEDYADNLRDREVDESLIKDFVDNEKNKTDEWYEKLDSGKPSEDIYYDPTNWDLIAKELKEQSDIPQEDFENVDEEFDLELDKEMLKDFDPDGLLKERLDESYENIEDDPCENSEDFSDDL